MLFFCFILVCNVFTDVCTDQERTLTLVFFFSSKFLSRMMHLNMIEMRIISLIIVSEFLHLTEYCTNTITREIFVTDPNTTNIRLSRIIYKSRLLTLNL